MVPRGHGSGHVVRASLCRAIWNSSIADFVVRLGYHSGCLKIPICMAHIKWLKHSSPGIALWQVLLVPLSSSSIDAPPSGSRGMFPGGHGFGHLLRVLCRKAWKSCRPDFAVRPGYHSGCS